MTQQELNRHLMEAVNQLRGLGIPISQEIDPCVEVNTRAQRRLGCCTRRQGRYYIQVSARILGDPQLLQKTLLHELLHTCYGCLNHGKRWKAYAQKVGELTNMLGAGHILVQRFGDILDGKRTWPKELAFSNVRPTLPDAVAGDITAAMPYRAMINIINFIQAMDQVVPGFASSETLLYSPELKFYSNRVKMDEDFNTNVRGLHCLGDSSGWTRGLMMASVMGVLMGRRLA